MRVRRQLRPVGLSCPHCDLGRCWRMLVRLGKICLCRRPGRPHFPPVIFAPVGWGPWNSTDLPPGPGYRGAVGLITTVS